MHWVRMALLVLPKGRLCVSGQKQMCHYVSAIVLKNVRWANNRKHRVGLNVGFLVLSIFRFSVLSQWFTFHFIVISVFFLHLAVTCLWVEQSVFKATNLLGLKHLCGGLYFLEKSCYKSKSSAGFLMF